MRRLHKRALAAAERTLGGNHNDTLISIFNLAEVYRAQSRFGEADPQLLIARVAGPSANGLDEVPELNRQATEQFRQSRYAQSAAIAQCALELADGTIERDHLDTLDAIDQLLIAYRAGGRGRETEPLLKRMIETFERLRGADHPETLQRIGELAHLYRTQGRYDESEPFYKRIMEANERMLGVQHIGTHASVYDLAEVYRLQGRYGEAELLYKRALDGFEHVLGGENNPYWLNAAGGLAELYRDEGRIGEADVLLSRVEASRKRTSRK